MADEDKDRKAMDADLGKNIRKTEATSSLLQSTSGWLNNGKIRELIAVWRHAGISACPRLSL